MPSTVTITLGGSVERAFQSVRSYLCETRSEQQDPPSDSDVVELALLMLEWRLDDEAGNRHD